MFNTWKKPDTPALRITMALFLPSDIEKGRFFAHVALSELALELMVKWLKPLLGLDKMHKKWLSDSTLRYKN